MAYQSQQQEEMPAMDSEIEWPGKEEEIQERIVLKEPRF
jgi:hypothetical protein